MGIGEPETRRATDRCAEAPLGPSWCLLPHLMGPTRVQVWHDPAFKVYRGLGNFVVLLLCWGVDIKVGGSAGAERGDAWGKSGYTSTAGGLFVVLTTRHFVL